VPDNAFGFQGWPRLSETLPGPKDFHHCWNCGGVESAVGRFGLQRWQEHDNQDHPEPVVILLCLKCSEKIIEKHPRLYRHLDPNEPLPGSMPLCRGCRWSEELRCTSPIARHNGGAGMTITAPQPGVAFMDGVRNGKRTGWRQKIYSGPPKACTGREEVA
jgi:hypothetical protein